MGRSDGWGCGLHPAKSFEIPGVFDIVLCYAYKDLECIMGVGYVGRGENGGCWIIVLCISMKILMIPFTPPIIPSRAAPGPIIPLGNRIVRNLSNGVFLGKVAKFTCGDLLYHMM